jgi:aryl-alcohol dehydrogenase-like predicted oxidoreductase
LAESYETPIEETWEALHEVEKSGRVRHIVASSMVARQSAKTLNACSCRCFRAGAPDEICWESRG